MKRTVFLFATKTEIPFVHCCRCSSPQVRPFIQPVEFVVWVVCYPCSVAVHSSFPCRSHTSLVKTPISNVNVCLFSRPLLTHPSYNREALMSTPLSPPPLLLHNSNKKTPSTRVSQQKVFLHVNEINEAALRLYESCGYDEAPDSASNRAFTNSLGLAGGFIGQRHRLLHKTFPSADTNGGSGEQ